MSGGYAFAVLGIMICKAAGQPGIARWELKRAAVYDENMSLSLTRMREEGMMLSYGRRISWRP